MKQTTVMDMKTSQFPFGQLSSQPLPTKKVLIRKRLYYKTEKDHLLLNQKISILKNIYHKNAINFREVEDNQNGTIDVYYNYVPYSLQNFFTNESDCDHTTIKQIHRQLIKLAIHLAKNSLLTSFNPNRCGILLNADNKWQIKYYLPLNEIVITSDVTMLERSVQLFTVQALHFLDSLNQETEQRDSSIQRTLKNSSHRYRQSPTFSARKFRRQSQPYLKSGTKERRLSSNAQFLQFSTRKLSHVSRQKSQFSSDSLKQTNASTLFHTLRSSSNVADDIRKCDSTIMTLKPVTESVLEKAKRAKSRSKKALMTFNTIIKSMKIIKEIRVSIKSLEV